MEISLSTAQGRVPVTVLHLQGQLDGQNYQNLIEKARQLVQTGARDFVLDLSGLTYISSAGLVALHVIALLTRGESLPDLEQGWRALKSVDRSRAAGVQEHVKLASPRPEVLNVLEMVGFTSFFQIFPTVEEAIESF